MVVGEKEKDGVPTSTSTAQTTRAPTPVEGVPGTEEQQQQQHTKEGYEDGHASQSPRGFRAAVLWVLLGLASPLCPTEFSPASPSQ